MKKWLVFLCVILLAVSFILIIINKNTKQEQEQKIKTEEKQDKYAIDFKANQTIRVKLCKTDEVIAMDMNDYLRGVVASEMPAAYNLEALKAQALVARTYTYRKIMEKAEGELADVCDSFNHCQAFYQKDTLMRLWTNRGFDDALRLEYWNKINQAVVATQNQVITYNGEYIKAFFHASSPIKTENVDQIWGGVSIPYLLSVESKEFEDYANRYSEVFVSFGELESKIREKIDGTFRLKDIGEYASNIVVCENTTSDRVKKIRVGNCIISSEKLRTIFGLKSTLFTLSVIEDGVMFKVTGYGHGVGMSQVGANFLADQGATYLDIINHYYTGVEITTLK